jgi:hypothetical protein
MLRITRGYWESSARHWFLLLEYATISVSKRCSTTTLALPGRWERSERDLTRIVDAEIGGAEEREDQIGARGTRIGERERFTAR